MTPAAGARVLNRLSGFDRRTASILRNSSANLEYIISKVEAQGKPCLGQDEIQRLANPIVKFPVDEDFNSVLSSIVEVHIFPPGVLIAVYYGPTGGYEYLRVSGDPLDIEVLTDSDYLKYREELTDGRQHWPDLVPYDSLSDAMKSICSQNRIGEDPGLFSIVRAKKVFLDAVVFSSHRIFSHADIAKYPRTFGHTSYIMEQVGALECNMIKYCRQNRSGITPRIHIVAQPEGTIDYEPPEKLKYYQHVYLLRTENIESMITEVLQKKPDMIIGSDREGNHRASLLAQDLKAKQVYGNHAMEASWRGGPRMFARVPRKQPKD